MNPPLLTRRVRGFSLIELMVSLVIGMLALMFATRLVASSEGSKQASLGGSDSMQNGMLALFSMNSDAAQAGFGLNDTLLLGCNTVFADLNGYTLADPAGGGATARPLAPVVIESNGAAPDRITFYSGSSMSGTGTVRLTHDYGGGAILNIDRFPYGFAVGDVVVVAPETVGTNCSLAQVSALVTPPAPAQNQLLIAAGADRRFNTGILGAAFQGSAARVFNLGPAPSLAFHTWSVDNGFLRLRATDLTGASGAAGATVVDNVVSIKAWYGIDTRAGGAFTPDAGLQIGQWVDSDGFTGDYSRLSAVRLAVVARSKAPERPAPGAACGATTAMPQVFAKTLPEGVDQTDGGLAVNVAVAGDSVDWKCYRYRVFETIVPLRNSGWRPQ